MKAAVYYGDHRVVTEEVAQPEVNAQQVLIEVMACGVCGTDVHIFEGAKGAAETHPPVVLGHEFSGIIRAVGSEVRGFAPGDRVAVDPNNTCGSCYYCKNGLAQFCEQMIGYGTTHNGGFAQYCAVHFKSACKLGDQVSFVQGAMAEPIACCLHGIDCCNIQTGSTVMVVGGGTIGLIMIQLARMAGARTVILSEPIEQKRAIGKMVGADVTFDPLHEDGMEVLQAHGIERIGTVIECVGLKQTMLDAIQYAGKSSTVMLFGLGKPDDTIPVNPFELFRKECTLKASFINPYTQSRAVALLSSGRLLIDPLISHEISLEELGTVLADPSTRRNGKVIVVPSR